MEDKILTGKCEICNEKNSMYACPRCNIQYCSVQCYKNPCHIQCSEPFYEQWVQDEVSSMGGDSETSKRMADILRKMKLTENDNFDDGESEGSVTDSDDEVSEGTTDDRFANVDLDDSQQVWNTLTEDERKEFIKMLGKGEILNVIPAWIPWWTSGGDSKPEMAQNMQSLSQLTKSSPSPQLPAIVMNTLCAYLVTSRLLKGEVHGFCVEAVTAIWEMSKTLRGGADVSKCCVSFAEASRLLEEDIARKEEWFISSGFTFDRALLEADIDEIKQHGSNFVLLALSDILSLVHESMETLKTTKNMHRFTGSPPTKTQLKVFEKKIIFYIAWAKETNPQVWDSGIQIIDLTDSQYP